MKKEYFTISRNKRHISFLDIAGNIHIIPVSPIYLHNQTLVEAKNTDEEDIIAWFVNSSDNDIRVDAAVWGELESLLMMG